jgi:type I restriction-modification system DNA methylase subunit
MADAAALHDSLQSIAEQANEDMSERDVENLFLEQGFYDALDYEGTGTDLRSEFTLPDDRRPDYITLDTNEAVTAVYEFKTTGRDLPPHEDQLFHYMDYLRAEYGVLTNGEQLRLYQRGDSRAMLTVSLEAVTESQARDLVSALQKREFDLTDPEDVNRFLEDLEPIPLDAQAELGQEHFFDTFRLEDGSPFANLVTGLMDLLHELRDEQEAKFVQGAYDFWEATYADEPEEVPDSWDPFVSGEQSLRDFMFCLESGHALLARLLLAKATEDHDFFAGTGYDGMDDYFRGLQGFGQSINLDAFPVAANNLIGDMQDQLVEGLFQDDIFVWWTDGYVEQLSSGHETGASQFEDVARGTGDVERISEATRNRLSRAVAEVFFNVLRFDFADVEGDLLGDLYQRYFDPETRKALGEFYTPQPVIDYIMDSVGYERGVSNERLIDPACGSGTFLVEAVERYIKDVERYEDNPNWEEHLRDLCTQPRIVGLDIHPFAVLMAQIRFVVAILPAYREAKTQNPEFTLRRLPIYRTDTLRNERELTGADLGEDGTRQITFDAMTEDEQDVRIPVPLPVEVGEDENVETEDGFLVRRVRMPLFDTIQLETGVANFGEYFAALQGVLDTVKDHMVLAEEFGDDFDWTYQSGLEERINHYTEQDYSGVEEFFEPYVDDMLENVRYLQEEHNDGRLFKMFEDTVLALVVKNYMRYDYVVGNPPYVNRQNIPDSKDDLYRKLYETPHWHYDLYVLFIERGMEMLEEGGKLSYITSDQFMTRRYGEKLRGYLSDNANISEIIDFGDTGVFEDATNYPCILTLSKGKTTEPIPVVVVHEPIDLPMETVRQALGTENYENSSYTSFFVDPDNLTEEIWSLIPARLYDIFDRVQQENLTLEEVGEVISGARIGKDDVFIGEKLSEGTICDFKPQKASHPIEIENDLLRPIVKGKDVRRWQESWKGKYMIYPLSDDTVIPEQEFTQSYPETFDHFKSHENELRERVWFDQGPVELHGEWYAPMYIDSYETYQQTSVLTPALTDENNFALNETGSIFVGGTAGVLGIVPDNNIERQGLLGYLNSSFIGAYLKSSAPSKANGYYQLSEDLLNTVPISTGLQEIGQTASKITELISKERKISEFPDSYVDNFDGQLNYISYEWQTRRYPVEAKVQSDVDDEFTVQAGRKDTISDSAMYSEDRDARKCRAEYVHAAVDGRNVKSGEEMTIPIPRSDDGVVELLDRLEADREEVRQTDIEDLEAEIDRAVYDLFDLTEDEREVVEDYLEVF